MGIVGRLDQYASMLAGEFDDYSMSENLLLRSEQFDNASWTNFNSTDAANTTISPDGTTTADTLIPNVSATNGLLRQDISTLTDNTTYTFSIFLKTAGLTSVNLQFFNKANTFHGSRTLNLSTGVLSGSDTIGTSSIISYSNGWFRLILTNLGSGTGATTPSFRIVCLSTGDGTSGIYLWGAQVEQGSSATDYTPTTTTAISRVLPSTTNTNITGLSTYFSSGFSENVGVSTTLVANVFPPYDLVYDDFGGTLFGVGQGRYMRQNTDKSVIVYNEIDEITDLFGRGIVRDGLVLDLDAGISASYSGSGTTWTDLSASDNNGTLTNGPTYSSANGGSLVFDGSNDFIDFTSDSNLLPTAGLTVSSWFKTTVADRWLLTKASPSETNGYILAGNAAGFMSLIVNTRVVSTSSPITTGAWINLVGTWTPSTSLILYRNGVLNSAITTSIPASIIDPSFTLEIARRDTATDYWNGNIASVQIYNRALTASEVTQNYNALKHRFGL